MSRLRFRSPREPQAKQVDEHSGSFSLASLLHLAPLLGLGLPPMNVLIPWLIGKVWGRHDEDLNAQAKESLNFQLSLTIYGVVFYGLLALLVFSGLGSTLWDSLAPLFATDGALSLLGFLAGMGPMVLLLPVFGFFILFPLMVMFIAVLYAQAGRLYRYPLSLRLIQ